MHPERQLVTTSPHTVTESPQGIVVQSGSAQAVQTSVLLQD